MHSYLTFFLLQFDHGYGKREFFFFWLENFHLKNTVVPTNSKPIFTLNFQDLMSMINYVTLEGKTRMISFPIHLTKIAHA